MSTSCIATLVRSAFVGATGSAMLVNRGSILQRVAGGILVVGAAVTSTLACP
jgi:hypothetical protein